MTIAALSLDFLARHCAEETEKFSRREANDPRYCFELLRRALADHIPDAFTHAYRIFEPQVRRWVYSHRDFEQTEEDADFFTASAIARFYFGVSGPKFMQFPALPPLLKYLKMCVHTAILQYLRDRRGALDVPFSDETDLSYTPDLESTVDANGLWEHICRLLPDEKDRLLAHCVFVQDMKPAQVVHSYPEHWSKEREVSVDLQRIRRGLRRDSTLRNWAGAGQ
jgi:hypothetical protein